MTRLSPAAALLTEVIWGGVWRWDAQVLGICGRFSASSKRVLSPVMCWSWFNYAISWFATMLPLLRGRGAASPTHANTTQTIGMWNWCSCNIFKSPEICILAIVWNALLSSPLSFTFVSQLTVSSSASAGAPNCCGFLHCIFRRSTSAKQLIFTTWNSHREGRNNQIFWKKLVKRNTAH